MKKISRRNFLKVSGAMAAAGALAACLTAFQEPIKEYLDYDPTRREPF